MKILKFLAFASIPVLLFLQVRSCKNNIELKKQLAQNSLLTTAQEKQVLQEAEIINRKINKEGIETVTAKALSNILPVKAILTSQIVDSISKANKIKPKQIIAYSSVNFVSKATYLKAVHENDSLKQQVFKYRNKWISMTYQKKDSTDTTGYFGYKYEAELNSLQYWERYKFLGLRFGRKTPYINTALLDSNATINSIKGFNIPYQKRKFSASLQLRSIYNYRQNKFLLGPGVSFDFNETLNILGYAYYNPAFSRWEYVVGINKNLITF